MKKIVRLTESDLIKLVKRVINEQNNTNQTPKTKAGKYDATLFPPQTGIQSVQKPEGRTPPSVANFCKIGSKWKIEVNSGVVVDLTTNKVYKNTSNGTSPTFYVTITNPNTKLIETKIDENYNDAHFTIYDANVPYENDIIFEKFTDDTETPDLYSCLDIKEFINFKNKSSLNPFRGLN